MSGRISEATTTKNRKGILGRFNGAIFEGIHERFSEGIPKEIHETVLEYSLKEPLVKKPLELSKNLFMQTSKECLRECLKYFIKELFKEFCMSLCRALEILL